MKPYGDQGIDKVEKVVDDILIHSDTAQDNHNRVVRVLERCRQFGITINTVQMAKWYRASASGSVDLGFDSESGQTNDFKIGTHSFPA